MQNSLALSSHVVLDLFDDLVFFVINPPPPRADDRRNFSAYAGFEGLYVVNN